MVKQMMMNGQSYDNQNHQKHGHCCDHVSSTLTVTPGFVLPVGAVPDTVAAVPVAEAPAVARELVDAALGRPWQVTVSFVRPV
jgi:hypothetical protein